MTHYLYRLFDESDTLLYVGVSQGVARRIERHLSCNGTIRARYHHHDSQPIADREDALDAEREVIRTERPLLNVQHKPGGRQSDVSLRLRTDRLDECRQIAGIATDNDLANRMGINPGNLSRVLSGKQEPGPRFIACLVKCFPGAIIDDLFTVESSVAA